MCCAAGLAVLDVMESEKLMPHAYKVSTATFCPFGLSAFGLLWRGPKRLPAELLVWGARMSQSPLQTNLESESWASLRCYFGICACLGWWQCLLHQTEPVFFLSCFQVGEHFKARLSELARKLEADQNSVCVIGDVRGTGLFVGVEFCLYVTFTFRLNLCV